ncbi:hypothetical protein PACTADRAFT_39572 [Pachysolen tannophilus NRRL Y-2460]|uniref:phosphoserine phosphatase n=1 Tax=Pachysolen tannophilus NRRL Y-2460 TaxID=669874 RepID=A0A1E4TZZ4_PACTA|nr:hypothetical protein PACTADRAFT_39572 [Pachysolen tannophilus NRRL Y-2460]
MTKILSENRVVDYQFNSDLDFNSIRSLVRDFSKFNKLDTDLILQKNSDSRKVKKLFVFDMDSTLIYQEVIELIAAYAGVEDKVAEITTAAMNGEIDFKQSLAARVKLLKGIDSSIWEDLKLKIQITNGAYELTKGLKKMGCKLAVLSGGFQPLADYVANELKLDYAFANNLQTMIDPSGGKQIFSGITYGEVVDGNRKADLLKQIADENSISYDDAVAVGDGANDLKMMSVAGWGIAWNAKPKVQELAPCSLNSKSLKDIFYILGYDDNEIKSLLE